MFQLRNYQLETINNVYKSMAKGNRSIIVQQPPRTGKTVIMAEIARRATEKGNRVLFIVHRKEIVDQVKRTFIANEVDMNLATVGMVQTLTRKVDKLNEPKVIFVDEAHHVLAKSYRRILEAFSGAVKLLFTATPWRMSGEGFEDVASDLIIGKPISWLIENDFLAPVDYYAPKEIDTAALKVKRNGEFDEKSIEDALKPKIYGNVVKTFKKLSLDRQAIVYTYNVKSAEQLAATFNRNGITAKAVTGQTPKDLRDAIIRAYREGKIQVVTNAELFTEGLDLPNVDTVVMLRPTKSLSLYLQFAMRAMNPREGKRALIIDHVGNNTRFGLPTDEREWSIKGHSKNSTSESIKSLRTCTECFASFYPKGTTCPFCGADLTEQVEENQIEVDETAELEKVQLSKRMERIKKITSNKLIERVAGKSQGELESYEEVKAYQKLMGYKPGWAYFYSKQRGFIK